MKYPLVGKYIMSSIMESKREILMLGLILSQNGCEEYFGLANWVIVEFYPSPCFLGHFICYYESEDEVFRYIDTILGELKRSCVNY